jgi:hypothetical protein
MGMMMMLMLAERSHENIIKFDDLFSRQALKVNFPALLLPLKQF